MKIFNHLQNVLDYLKINKSFDFNSHKIKLMNLKIKEFMINAKGNNRIAFYSTIILAIAGFSYIILNTTIAAQQKEPDNSDCYACHEDTSLKGKKNGKTISVFVSEKKLKASTHYGAACIDCHVDLKDADLPHEDDLPKAKCGKCHQEAQKNYDIGLHGQASKKGDPLAPSCQSCHGSHEITKVNDPNSPVSPIKIPYLCGRCHQEGSPVQLQRNIPQTHILENYTESIHGYGLLHKGLVVTATCASCHSAHLILPHTDNRSSISRGNIAKTCTKCHARIEEVHQKVINGQKWEKEAHILPACVDCHQPHKIRKVYYAMGLANDECLKCHQRQDIKASSDGRSLFVDTRNINHSVHSKTACSQCHTDVMPSSKRPCESIQTKVNCGSCHENVKKNYDKSMHGELHALKDKDAPDCKTCHGSHEVLAKKNPESTIFPSNIPKLCSSCHMDGKKIAMRIKDAPKNLVSQYSESIHGKGLTKSGLTVTATCADCHTAHSERHHKDKTSSTNPDNIAHTCGKCHYGIEKQFDKSIHSKFVSTSKERLPTCKDCHSAHSIKGASDNHFRMDIMKTCGKCHEKITKTYFDTYHGKVSQLGSQKAAKCYDCHGAHDILPVDNPESHLSRENVVATCQKCHPNANRRFAGYLTHATHHDPEKYPFLFYAFWGMTSLLIGTFLISWLHTLLWLPRSIQMRKTMKLIEANHPNDKRVMRFTPLNRALHIIMICSFLTLAVTGMLLKFSYTEIAQTIVVIYGGAEGAGIFHRIAAAFLMGIFIVHIFDLFRVKKEEFGSWKNMLFGPDSLVPNLKDAQDAKASILWFIGKGPQPQYGRWTYWEKFDYFAVFWGIFIIGSTGFSLWFPSFFTKIIPGEFLNIATIIHSDEALLAAGFIFTVHFFNTHFRPEKFPMDTVVFTGSYSLEEFKHDRPVEYQKLVESGKLEKLIVPPPSKSYERLVKVFGWAALTTGLCVVVFIIYSMLYLYK